MNTALSTSKTRCFVIPKSLEVIFVFNTNSSLFSPSSYPHHLFETALSKISHPPQECWAETFKYLKLGASVRRTEKTAGEGRAQRRDVYDRLLTSTCGAS
ncbi:hypothetical protein DdX_17572 [Ditylenchus destructor]|uniref:Uncharacterized protein n=1 Tax=Ditylenchus destructor TaxID=166010 RepID=A0AAD4MLH5_9BILA|nr:hypothetical protein DdX_17572 [Ditylenchus destructor]